MLELDSISLLPTELNSGSGVIGKFNFAVQDFEPSLPIFTSPMEAVVGVKNWEVWQKNGIKPVIPRTEPLEVRLEACCYIFAAFSKEEIRTNFMLTNRRSINSVFRVCIDAGNGHDSEVLQLGKELKRIYGPQIITMGGNIGNPRTYVDYCRADFDYVRVGLSSGSLVDVDKYGFSYPMAQLLIDLDGVKKTAGVGLKETKIIADGGIRSHADILKCIALGADYVMIGREFAKLLEANGNIYKEVYDQQAKQRVLVEEDRSKLGGNVTPEALKRLELVRVYRGNTTNDIQAMRDGYTDSEAWKNSGKKKRPVDSRCDNVNVVSTLGVWLSEMFECFSYGFIMTSSVDWKSFKNNAKYIKL